MSEKDFVEIEVELNHEDYKILCQMAKEKNVSLNDFVNDILKKMVVGDYNEIIK